VIYKKDLLKLDKNKLAHINQVL